MMMNKMVADEGSLLHKLLRRGDRVAIEHGCLAIYPASGQPVPAQWLADNGLRLCREVLELTGLDAFEYIGYDTGYYGKSRAGGVALQFESLLTGAEFYAVFNVGLKRERSSKNAGKGDPLPKGQFNPPPGGEFIRFWRRTGLMIPNRLPKIYKHMGTIKRLLLTGEISKRQDGRLEKTTITPLQVSSNHIREAAMRDKKGTSEGLTRDKEGTRLRDKKTARNHTEKGLQPSLTTGILNCGNTVTRKDGNRISLPYSHASPTDQSVDDWLNEYDLAESLI